MPPANPNTISHDRKTIAGLLGGIFLIVFLSFGPVLFAEFLNWDDDTHLYKNPLIRSLTPANIKKIFFTPINDIYIPLTTLSFALEYHFVGLKPFVYHLDNLLLHLGNVGLIVLFALRCGLSRWAAALGALIFGIHPMHMESVAWVTERKDVLYAFFYMGSLIFYHAYLSQRRWGFFLGSAFSGFLSILAKPMALSLPLVLLLCDRLWKRKWDLRVLLEKLPFFAFVVPIAWMSYSLNARMPGGEPVSSVLIWIWTFSFYPMKFIFPQDLIPYYVLPKPIHITNPEYALAVLFFSLVVFSVIRLRTQQWFVFAIGFYFVSIFFLLRFDDLGDISIVADRFMYLPSLGFCLGLGLVFDRILASLKRKDLSLRILTYGVVSIILLFLAIKTHLQARIWKDNLTFWNYVIGQNEMIPRAYNDRGVALVGKGQYELALTDFSQAIRLHPQYIKAYCNRADTYLLIGKMDWALRDLNTVIQSDGRSVRAYSMRGLIYGKKGDYDFAIRDFTRALELNPRSAKDYNNRGVTHKKRGDYDLALRDYSQALQLNPDFYEAYMNRGAIYKLTNRIELAAADYTHALRINPHSVEAYTELKNLAPRESNENTTSPGLRNEK